MSSEVNTSNEADELHKRRGINPNVIETKKEIALELLKNLDLNYMKIFLSLLKHKNEEIPSFSSFFLILFVAIFDI